MAKRRDFEDVYIHCFLDGRDTPPASAETYIMQLEEKITNLEMHIQHLTSNSKQKNYDKVIEMLENLKAKSNQQKIQITNLEAQLKKEREKKE
mgnify:CR=1 FL=1